MTSTQTRPINIAIAAMGGQGGGVLADWIISVAENNDYIVQATSVPGVAQRTGATVYYIEIFPRNAVPASGGDPVMALIPVPGDVDIVIAGELVEAARAVIRGIVTPDRTTVIASAHRDYALSEKMAMGDGRADSATILHRTRASAKELLAFDMAVIAENTGSVISAVLLGALAAANVLPFSPEQFEGAIKRSNIDIDRNLTGFAAGYARAHADNEAAQRPEPPAASIEAGLLDPKCIALKQRVEHEIPAAAQEIALAGLHRVVDYQDPNYGGLYLDRLQPIVAIDNEESKLLSSETARYLALWMSYEDTIRVAELKIRRERFDRFRSEVGARPDQIVRVTEFMHPRFEEICDTLPAGLGRSAMNSATLRKIIGLFCRRGRKIRTSSLPGFLLLYGVSALKPWRRRTLRYQRENESIEYWLRRIRTIGAENYHLAVELAECQRLIKGYGDTHERGLRNYRAILSQLDHIASQPDAALTLRHLRDAALADEAGQSLRDVLEQVA
jgi:indolepyruvate ferredoxin oxidoreductase beta subunit